MTFDNIKQALYDDKLDQFTASELIDCLKAADDLYYNDEESFLTDNEYDILYQYARRLEPHNVYFTGVGSEVRGGKIELPYGLGSLNQVHIGDLNSWVFKWNLQSEEVVITDKMDGTSALIIYDIKGHPQIAYSRGDGLYGADISRHIFKINNVPKKVNGPLVVRAEVELSDQSFYILREAGIKQKSGKPYKNPRNMVAGIMNSESRPDIVYQHLSVIAYEVKDFSGSKEEQLKYLDSLGFRTPPWMVTIGRFVTDDTMSAMIKHRKAASDFAIDGIVIDVNSAEKRKNMNPSKETLNPEYSIKYKVTAAENLATTIVRKVEWNLSKHGYWKPRLIFDPVDLVGVTIRHASGFNAKFILDNNVGPGTKIQITRSGDVTPFCQKVLEGTTAQMPPGDWEWTINDQGEKVDAFITENNDTVTINQMIDFFTKIKTPHLKEGNIKKLYKAGFTSPQMIIRDLSKRQAIDILGENGKKVFDGLHSALQNIPLYLLLGAFSNERGLGVRKFKKLQRAIGMERLLNKSFNKIDIVSVDSFDVKTADKVIAVLSKFEDFMNYIDQFVVFSEDEEQKSDMLSNEKICFSGFRDAELSTLVEQLGGTIQSGVSGKTTMLVTKDPNATTGKPKKARELGIKIMSVDEFKQMVNSNG